MTRLRHATRLLADLIGFTRYTGATWLIPVIVLLLLAMALAIGSQVAVPYLVYTFF